MNRLEIAHALADAARLTTLAAFTGVNEEWRKGDGSVVTQADLACERRIRALLTELAPQDEMLGEEEGDPAQTAVARWVVDPIDGTENFRRGHPVWGTLIAYGSADETSVAVVDAPALGRRWWAVRGAGAFTDGGVPLSVSLVQRAPDATAAFGGLHEFAPGEQTAALVEALAAYRCSWGWGNFWGHVLVAEGSVDVAISNGTSIWDVAAPSLVVSEAGGEWCDLSGERSLTSGSLVTSSRLLFPTVVDDFVGLLG